MHTTPVLSEDLNQELLRLVAGVVEHARMARRAERLWKEIEKAIADGRWLQARALLREKEDWLLRSAHQESGVVERLCAEVEANARGVLRHFPDYLEQAGEAAGLPLDRQSSHPHYYLRARFYRLDIDEEQGTATLLNQHRKKLVTIPADISSIITEIQKQSTRLFERAFESDRFLAALRGHYLAIVEQDGAEYGASVQVQRIYHRFRQEDPSYRADEFAVDLSWLVDSGVTEVEGNQLDLQQSRESKDAIRLTGDHVGGYISYITFRRVS